MERLLPSQRDDEGRKRRGEILFPNGAPKPERMTAPMLLEVQRRIEARRRTSSSNRVTLELVR
ncbi:MAG: hypothetical protein ACREWE_14695 [Gammaproteobacteria bacterium]